MVSSDSTLETGLPPVIEMLGVPGSGKTFVAEMIAAAAPDADVRLVRGRAGRLDRALGAVDKLRLSAALVASSPRATARLMSLVLRHEPPVSRLPKVVLNWLWMLARIRGAEAADPLVVDQGIGQALWSTCFRSHAADPAVSRRLVDAAMAIVGPREWTIVVVEAKPSVVSARISSRTDGRSPFDAESPGGQLADAYRAMDSTRAALESAAAVERVDIVAIDNSGDGDMLRRELVKMGLLGGGNR